MTGQAGRLRIVFAVLFLVAIIGLENGVGALAASDFQRRSVTSARVILESAHQAFLLQLDQGLADGSPEAELREWETQEKQAYRAPGVRASGFVDASVSADLHRRTDAIKALRRDIADFEASVESTLQDQLLAAIDHFRGLFPAAQAAGLDVTAEVDWCSSESIAAWRSRTPVATQQAIQEAKSRAAALTDVTATRVAEAAAAAARLAAARADAAYGQQRADAAVAAARGTGVLDVADAAAAIQALEVRLPAVATADDFEAIAQELIVQARTVESLLAVRRTAFGMLVTVRQALARADGIRANTDGMAARIEAAAAALNTAATFAAIGAAANEIKNITTALDAAYAEAVAHPPPPVGAIVMNMPFFAQLYSLDCEEAALQMALAYQGISVSQDQVIAAVGVDRTPPSWDSAGNLHWGDPYTAFVGDPNGYREGTGWGAQSGYGTYFPTIARAATSFGARVMTAGERVTPAALYDAVWHNHPAVVWVAYAWSPHSMSTYVANDGRTVMYGAPWEHAVAVAGVSPGSILINNPHGGPQWIDKATFEASYAMFDNMAVILQ